MKIFEILTGSKLDVEIDDRKTRLFYYGYLKDSEKDWVDSARGRKLDVEATVDLSGDTAYIALLDSHRRGRGFGTELLQFILNDLSDRGIREVTAYVEAVNSDPIGILRANGFTELKRSTHGTTFARHL